MNKVRPERTRDRAGDKKAIAVKYVVNNFVLKNRQFYFLRYTEG